MLIVTTLTLVGCGVLAFIFWMVGGRYRAAVPLIFILGAALAFFPTIRTLLRRRRFRNGRNHHYPLSTPRLTRIKRYQKRQLWRNGIPHLITSLYFNYIQYYPEWVHDSRDYVPSSITAVSRDKAGNVHLLLYYAQYVFTLRTNGKKKNNGPDATAGTLEIVREGHPVLMLTLTQGTDRLGVSHWIPVSVGQFMVGDWMREINNLRQEIIAILKDRARDARES